MSELLAGDVVIRVEGAAGSITLNRPRALNALTLGMVRDIWQALLAWRDDPSVELVILEGAGDRGLCAGGDVRWLYDSRTAGSGAAMTFWREEYQLNALIHRYPKPFIPFMDGIVMGGGIGLSAHAQGGVRIVTERSELAMPETSIGLIPDVGGTWLLARAPGAVGAYLGLTGERMLGAGTIFAGFADHFVPSERLADLKRSLVVARAANVAGIVSAASVPPPHSDLADRAPMIDRLFAHHSVPAIFAALESEASDWSKKVLAALRARSPLALAATLDAIQAARRLGSLEAALDREFRVCRRLFEGGEFIEGVRALIIDKDRNPHWRPASIADLVPATVTALSAPFEDGAEELGLRAPD